MTTKSDNQKAQPSLKKKKNTVNNVSIHLEQDSIHMETPLEPIIDASLDT